MRVQIVQPGQAHPGIRPELDLPEATPASFGPWRPEVALGAKSAGRLLLPSAQATATSFYAPRGVYLDDDRVIVSDTGNHRVLIFHGRPAADGPAADVVLGQPDLVTEGPAAGGRGPANGMFLPTGVLVSDGRLVVADAWHHRILIWNQVPTGTATPPDLVLGQPDGECVEPNSGGRPNAATMYWPFGIAVLDGRFYVTDTGNRRVLCWPAGVPWSNQPAELVLGQPDPHGREENRGGQPSAASFRWPHAVTGHGRHGVLIADAGNHRVLGWHAQPAGDLPADFVLGQPDMVSASEFPYGPHAGNRFRFPYAIAAGPAGELAIADTANNRLLIWNQAPAEAATMPDQVLGQRSFSSNGENRWEQVGADTLCWPYGLCWSGDRIAIADSGNNRVMIWSRARDGQGH